MNFNAAPYKPGMYVLRNELQLQGPRFGCGLAQCGSCSVLVNGEETRSCVTPVAAVQGKSVTTLEGLPAWYGRKKSWRKCPRCIRCNRPCWTSSPCNVDIATTA